MPEHPPWSEPLIASFRLHLRSEHKSPNTIRIYVSTARAFAAWLDAETDVDDWANVEKPHVQAWIADLLDRLSAGYANNQFRALQQFWRWMLDEDEVPASPMAGMSQPALGERLIPVLSDGEISALLAACEGRDFISRRDMAIIRLFLAAGLRLAEMADLPKDAVDLENRAATVIGKGDRERAVRYDPRTARAIDRYLRLRARHKAAGSPLLWLPERDKGGRLTPSGIYQMVERRGEAAGLDLNPHQLRHTWAHRFRAGGGLEGDLMALAGWKSTAMAHRYGRSAAGARAMTAYDRVDVMGGL